MEVLASQSILSLEKHDYLTYGFDTVKEQNAFVKRTKQLIRNSIEYKNWVSLIHKYPLTDVCTLTGLANAIEIHHEPIRLQTYVETAINILMTTGQGFTTFDVAKLVIDWHYNNLVGWVTLTKPVHEAVHDGDLFVPSYLVRGDWIAFVAKYWKYMPEDAVLKVYGYYQKHVEYDLPSTFVLRTGPNQELHIEYNNEVIDRLANVDFVRYLIRLAQERLDIETIIKEATNNAD